MTRIKYCGMTRVDDALEAARLGVDAIGLVFARRSTRCIDGPRARAIRAALPPFVSIVALLMDDDVATVEAAIEAVQPDLLQFHGRETDAWCAQFGRPYLKALGMAGGAGLARLGDYPGAAGLLLDGHGLGEPGGTGRAFDWSLLTAGLRQPLILAGGLDAGNVGDAIRAARPWAVDVSSGIEISPGIKDAAKMAAFVGAVRQAADSD